jgi:hypothetical protein
MGGACSLNRGENERYRLFVGKPEGKRPLGRARRRWTNNIKINVGEIEWGWCGLEWPGSGYGQVESSCECGYEPSCPIKCCETIKWIHNWWPLE